MSRKKRNNKKKNVEDFSTKIAKLSTNRGKQKKVNDPVQNYGYRDIFSPCEYDLSQISLVEDGESYVRQAFQKKTSLMFKEGEVFTGKNKETINYIKTRIRQIEFVTGLPWRSLLKMTGKDLIAKSNFFWVKVRREDASGADKGVNNKAPVAGYFPLPPETVKIKKNKAGKIIKYRQELPGKRYKEWSPDNVIHFKHNLKPGFTFGTPDLISVIPDIQALRRIEENVEVLFYQTLFPIFHYKVGTETKPAGKLTLLDGSVVDEVDHVSSMVRSMPTEGGLVTPERHSIDYIGAEGEIPSYQHVLQYFKSRVLSGLGISSIDIGEGDSSNRATSDSLSKALIDSVKNYQDVFEQTVNAQIINELLLEGGFPFDPLAEENYVEFKFKEIDIEEQMKKNVNVQLLYNADIIDLDEARKVTGREPLEDMQEEGMFTQRQTLRVLEAEAVVSKDLAKISAAQTAATAKANTTKSKSASKSGANSSKPTNQHGTKTGPQKSRLDHLIKNEQRILQNLQGVIDKTSLEYRSCVLAAHQRLSKKASLIKDKDEKSLFLEKIQIMIS